MSWVSVGVAAVSIGSSIMGGQSAKKAAKKAARSQAKLTFFQRQEEMRRQQRQNDYQAGAGVAAAGASNIQISGSTKRYLDGSAMENARQMAHARQAAHLEREAIKAGAQGAGDALFAKAAGDAIGFAASMYTNRAQPTSTTSTYSGGGPVSISTSSGNGAGQQTSSGRWTVGG